MKKGIYILLLILINSGLFSQKLNVIDSLRNELYYATEDTLKISLLNDIANKYSNSSPDSTFKYAENALQISNDIDYILGKAKAYRMIGLAYSGKSEYENALKYFFLSIKEARNAGDIDYISIVYTSIGIVYRKKSEYKEALTYYLKSLEIIKIKGEPDRISTALNNVGIIYKIMNDYDKALEYYYESLSINQKVGYREGIGSTLGNIGILYKEKKEFDKSISYLKDALVIFEEFNLKNQIAHVHTNLGEIYIMQKKYQEAFTSIQISNKIYAETQNKSGSAETYLLLGDIFFNQKKYNTAESAFALGLKISKEIGYKEYEIDSYLYLSKLDSARNNYRQALNYYKKHISLKDSIFRINNKNQIVEIQSKYDLSEKERENIILKKNAEISDINLRKQKTINYFIWALSGLLILVVIYITTSLKRQRKTNKILNQKNDEIIAQNVILEEYKEKITNQFEEIGRQNVELETYKNELEQLVDDRTLELNTALHEAKISDNLKTEFLLNLSHEIRTPLNAISGFSDLISDNINNLKYEYIISMQKSMDDLIKTIDRLVKFSSYETGDFQINPQQIEIDNFLNRVMLFVSERKEFLKKDDINVEFQIDFLKLPKFFYTDRSLLKTVINELIENAFKFTDKGLIIITAEYDETNLIIKIKDTGVGIKKDIIPLIYDFMRKFDNNETLYRGLGIGLALVKKALELLSGEIKFNTLNNEGAEFIISIPEMKE